MKLNIGCGLDIKFGYVNIDKSANHKEVMVLDIEKDKLPFEDGSVDEIICNQTIEHLSDPVFAVKEMKRVLKKGGRLIASVPTYSYTFCHIRPRNTRNTFDILVNPNPMSPDYIGGGFECIRIYGTRNSGLVRWILFRLKTKFQDFLDTTLHQHLIWEGIKK